MKVKRNIVRIDESLCDGCGACIPSCHEGALRIVDGKARLVGDVYCDGLGACLGHCPRGAITIEEREAEEFDENAVNEHMEKNNDVEIRTTNDQQRGTLACGCPGTMARSLAPRRPALEENPAAQSQLANWPVQLTLIPPTAPWLRDADLLLLADCAAVASPSLHSKLLRGRGVAIACPKLDDADAHAAKLAAIIRDGRPRSIEVVIMDVPCCRGLYEIARRARDMADVEIALSVSIMKIEEGEAVAVNL